MQHDLAPIALPRRLGSALGSDAGFTLIEVLVGTVVIAVTVAATAGLFGTAINIIRRTGLLASQGSVIDADISRIGELSVNYNACTTPTGSFAACPGQAVGTSYYYFPSTSANATAFFSACNSTTASSHITANFIAAINNLPQPGSGVTRQTAQREDGSNSGNHVVVIRWQTATQNPIRVLKTLPVLSAWCN
ncbi:type II secretion system protein [Cyanobium sp. NIES-981]|uniref:type II secretion system protein n=1 Tax=Cyanobium sp. NIES-981 TaxID=1851505 RepID=UPI000B35462D|nr:type II secretion system protein [Cyanobium sp. NIES-981]